MSTALIEPGQLKKVRVQLEITQSALAKAAGVSQSLIAKVEAGKVDPSFTTMKSLSLALRTRMASRGKKASDVMSSPVIGVQSKATISECVALMKRDGVSQLPIFSGAKVIGAISEGYVIGLLTGQDDPKAVLAQPVSRHMQGGFPIVEPNTPIEALYSLFNFVPAVLVASGDKVEGIIAKIDMISADIR